MFVSSTYRITRFPYTCERVPISAAYVTFLYLQNHRDTLHLWVYHLKCNLSLLALPIGLLGYTTLIGALSYLQPMFVWSAYKINGLH